LRIEPAATYYLRTARGYAFLARFLDAAVGEEALRGMHGLRQTGPRAPDLYTELRDMRDRFYGFYLMSCEDVGLRPENLSDEGVDISRCQELASSWREGDWMKDIDLSADTRVAVPVLYDQERKVTRLWVTLGVRLARLEASFLRPPSIRPADGSAEWKELEPWKMRANRFLIPVDEFAEVELKGSRVISREELRAVCDRFKTKAQILAELQR
jgi:hypothetical protein